MKDQNGFLQLTLPQRCCAGCEGFAVSQLLGLSNPRLYLRQIALTMACCSAAGLPPETLQEEAVIRGGGEIFTLP